MEEQQPSHLVLQMQEMLQKALDEPLAKETNEDDTRVQRLTRLQRHKRHVADLCATLQRTITVLCDQKSQQIQDQMTQLRYPRSALLTTLEANLQAHVVGFLDAVSLQALEQATEAGKNVSCMDETIFQEQWKWLESLQMRDSGWNSTTMIPRDKVLAFESAAKFCQTIDEGAQFYYKYGLLPRKWPSTTPSYTLENLKRLWRASTSTFGNDALLDDACQFFIRFSRRNTAKVLWEGFLDVVDFLTDSHIGFDPPEYVAEMLDIPELTRHRRAHRDAVFQPGWEEGPNHPFDTLEMEWSTELAQQCLDSLSVTLCIHCRFGVDGRREVASPQNVLILSTTAFAQERGGNMEFQPRSTLPGLGHFRPFRFPDRIVKLWMRVGAYVDDLRMGVVWPRDTYPIDAGHFSDDEEEFSEDDGNLDAESVSEDDSSLDDESVLEDDMNVEPVD